MSVDVSNVFSVTDAREFNAVSFSSWLSSALFVTLPSLSFSPSTVSCHTSFPSFPSCFHQLLYLASFFRAQTVGALILLCRLTFLFECRASCLYHFFFLLESGFPSPASRWCPAAPPAVPSTLPGVIINLLGASRPSVVVWEWSCSILIAASVAFRPAHHVLPCFPSRARHTYGRCSLPPDHPSTALIYLMPSQPSL